jgi:hypothetical protein
MEPGKMVNGIKELGMMELGKKDKSWTKKQINLLIPKILHKNKRRDDFLKGCKIFTTFFILFTIKNKNKRLYICN